ncbi:MAG: methionine gamma-lyase family protein [Firmicutes bacterium]|nr:methionine gamma-lyase family protein [Bacillota bacterium]
MKTKIAAARKIMQEYAAWGETRAENNFLRVLDAFREQRVSAQHFSPSTGYGYNDAGRDKLEQVYAQVFGGEAALVRQQIVSGSHAIALALFGNLLPGDELLCCGMPYDTLQTVIGIKKNTPGCLRELSVSCRVIDIDFADPDCQKIVDALGPKTKMVALQRSCGYALRPALTVANIEKIAAAVKAARPDVLLFVDNCYGEMVEEREPTMAGADIIAGSLIKNPGAGVAPGGGYLVGKQECIERAACRLTIPGAGSELGASLCDNRPFFQALFLTPQIVLEALCGAVFCAALLSQLGFAVYPAADAERADIIQIAEFGRAEPLIAFCQGIQKYSPVDSFVQPTPWPMPGYDNDIIMASGGFVAGSSIELSADAPLRPPYLLFIQGGLNRWHTIHAVCRTLEDMRRENLL